MTPGGLAWRSIRQYWRTQLGVVAGVAVASAILVGALTVGDSLRHTLGQRAAARRGQVELVLPGKDRFFQADLVPRLAGQAGTGRAAAVLQLQGLARHPDRGRRALDVQVLGVDAGFFGLAPAATGEVPGNRQVALNARLAEQLQVSVGDTVVVRVEKPGALPRDAALADAEDSAVALRRQVSAILEAEAFGEFALQAGPMVPFSVFLDRDDLAREVELEGRANLLLVGGSEDGAPDVQAADAAMDRVWSLADAELSLESLPDTGLVELQSRRVFLDPPVEQGLRQDGAGLGVLTYFVNEIRKGDQATPYSMVCGLGPLGARDALPGDLAADPVLAVDLADDEALIHEWLAEDLQAQAGDTLTLRHFVLGPRGRLVEEEFSVRVRAVLPMQGLAGDATLMPAFPGLHDAEHCREWETRIPEELESLRDQDEQYWDEHRGTPKLFLSLATAQEHFGNRFGALTAVRLPDTEAASRVQSLLQPAALGLRFQDLREAGRAAATAATDFGGLFLGLSLFLMVAALLLTGLLFVFGVEQRARELGILRALGFRERNVRGLWAREGLLLAVLGSLLGIGLGLGYMRLVLAGLSTIWSGAVGSLIVEPHVGPASVLGGAGIAVVMAWVTMFLRLKAQARRPVTALLASRPSLSLAGTTSRGRTTVAVIASLSLVGATLLALTTEGGQGLATAGAFFGAGSLLLVASLAAASYWLQRASLTEGIGQRHVSGLGLRNTVRRRGRSLATVALLACGIFLVLAVSVYRLEGVPEPGRRDSGTGGFTWVGRTSLPLLQDWDTADGREALGLDEEDVAGLSVVPFRVRDGDEASCLHLGVSERPRLLGVDPELLAQREAFVFAQVPDDVAGSPWRLLQGDADGAVPAIGDQASVQWAMRKSVGDLVEYRDEWGAPLAVRIVATLSGSLLQGQLIVSEQAFQEHYPSEPGHRFFLLDSDQPSGVDQASALERALADLGMELVLTADRLREFQTVQNTYLLIFQLLGALGLLLGSVGLGLVVLRNVLERRGELAVARAVGFSPSAVRQLVFSEHAFLLLMGLLSGGVAAMVALLPGWQGGGAAPGFGTVGWVLAGVALHGMIWVWWGTRLALRGSLKDVLSEEA